MERIGSPEVKKLFNAIAAAMETHRDRLIEADQAVGDGDLGLTMAGGFGGAAADIAAMDEPMPGKLLMRAGMAINKHAPSTMGTLMATGFMRGGKAVAECPEIAAPEFAAFLQAFVDGVMERGKAKPGEKTLVDALLPASQAARQSADAGKSLSETAEASYEAAMAGADAARAMMSQHGKAAVFREKTVGLDDPGCLAVCVLLQTMAGAISY